MLHQFLMKVINNFVLSFPGPLVLFLKIFKADHRQIIMFGAIISAASAIASTFSPSVEILILTYGILTGMWDL